MNPKQILNPVIYSNSGRAYSYRAWMKFFIEYFNNIISSNGLLDQKNSIPFISINRKVFKILDEQKLITSIGHKHYYSLSREIEVKTTEQSDKTSEMSKDPLMIVLGDHSSNIGTWKWIKFDEEILKIIDDI